MGPAVPLLRTSRAGAGMTAWGEYCDGMTARREIGAIPKNKNAGSSIERTSAY